MIDTLDKIEKNYDEFLMINNSVFDKIQEAKELVEDYKTKEESYSSYLNNLKELLKETDIKKLSN